MPEAFSLGPLIIPTLRVGTLLALLLATWLTTRLAEKRGLAIAWTAGVAEWGLWLGVAGARLGFVLANPRAYQDAPWTALYLWQPGYAPLVGVGVGAAYILWRIGRGQSSERSTYLRVFAGGFGAAALVVGALLVATRFDFGSDLLRVGDPAPEVRLHDLTGETVSLSDLAGQAGGQAVVLNFWATWCPPCRREMPLLDAVDKAYAARGVRVVGIDVGEPAEVVKRYIEEVGVGYPIWVDAPRGSDGFNSTQTLFSSFGGVGLPTTVFIDAEGVIRGTQVGELSRGILQSRIEEMLPNE